MLDVRPVRLPGITTAAGVTPKSFERRQAGERQASVTEHDHARTRHLRLGRKIVLRLVDLDLDAEILAHHFLDVIAGAS